MSKLKKMKSWLFANQGDKQTVFKNTVWLAIGQISSRILRAALVVYAARMLGAEGWGVFSYGLAIATFLTTFSDFGINALLTKEVAKSPENKARYLSTTFFIKITLLVALFVSALALRNVLTNIAEVKILIPILIFVFAFDALRDFGSSLMRSYEKMEIEAFLTFFANLSIVILGFIFINSSATSISLAYAYAIGSGLGFLMTIFVIKNHLKNFLESFDRTLIKTILVSAWPFGLMTLLGIVMLNTDIIMIGWLRSAEDVGFYTAGQKFIQLLYVLPTLFASALFPGFARLAGDASDKTALRSRLEKSLVFTFLMAIPLSLGGLFLGDQVISLLFGSSFAESQIIFQILSLTFLIVFPSIILSNALFAIGERKEFIRAVIIGIFVNIIANILLIPPMGIAGVAIATIISQLSSNFFFWRKIRVSLGFTILPHLNKIFFASIIMTAVVILLRDLGTGIVSNMVVAIVVYFGTLYATREETMLGMKEIWKS